MGLFRRFELFGDARFFSPSPAAGEGGPAHFSLLDFARRVLDQVRAGGRPRPTVVERHASHSNGFVFAFLILEIPPL
jgi:hypothetical protein